MCRRDNVRRALCTSSSGFSIAMNCMPSHLCCLICTADVHASIQCDIFHLQYSLSSFIVLHAHNYAVTQKGAPQAIAEVTVIYLLSGVNLLGRPTYRTVHRLPILPPVKLITFVGLV